MASFWRGLGYFLSIIIIIVGFLLFPIGLIGVVLGFIFIWMLRRSAIQEKIQKDMSYLADSERARVKGIADGEREKDEEERREEQRLKDEIKKLEEKKKQLEKEKGDE